MIKARPELFSAYVGFAQVVSSAENQAASYAKVTAAARAAGDDEKRFVLVPRAGHDPNRPLLDAVYRLLGRSLG